MKRLLFACIALVVVGLLILHQLGRLGELTAQLARLRREVALGKLSQLPESVAASVDNPAPPTKTKRLEELLRRAPKVMGGIPLLSPEKLFSDYPQLEATFLAAIEGNLRVEYGGFFALAGFSEQQIARFLEISMTGERDWIALTKEAQARGVTLSDPSIKLLGQEHANQRKREMEELLGPAGLALRERYREERSAREALTVMAKAAGVGSQALAFEQLNRLITVTTEIGVFDDDRPLQTIFSGASGKVAEILTPEQQRLFELMIDARQARLLRALQRRQSR